MSGEGWKQFGDDPYHTDWILGADLELSSWWGNESLQGAAYEAMKIIQTRGRGSDPLTGAVLVPLQYPVVGEAIHPQIDETWYQEGECQRVVVLPNLSPRYVQALTGASLVITENGGALAHLSQVSLERGIPILRVADALTHFPEGTQVRVEANSGVIEKL
jgi:phosphohistidine swiveling domain-containing protein